MIKNPLHLLIQEDYLPKKLRLLVIMIMSVFYFGGCQKDTPLNSKADFSSISYEKGVVNFQNLSTNASSYLWDFGDGSSSSEKSPIHSYSAIGQYQVKLTVKGSSGISTQQKFVTVFMSKGKVVFWVSSMNLGSVDVYINGGMAGTISESKLSSPVCGSSGCVTVSLYAGTYIWKASGLGLTGEVDVINDKCSSVGIF
jgi:PKD repeat protein